jgi:hypothetical protein
MAEAALPDEGQELELEVLDGSGREPVRARMLRTTDDGGILVRPLGDDWLRPEAGTRVQVTWGQRDRLKPRLYRMQAVTIKTIATQAVKLARPSQLERLERRRMARVATGRPLRLRARVGGWYPGVLRNLSGVGLRVELVLPAPELPAEERVECELDLPTGRIRVGGSVVRAWVERGAARVACVDLDRLAPPLEHAIVAYVMQRQRELLRARSR